MSQNLIICISIWTYQFMFAIKPQPETGKKPGTVPNHTAADGTQEDGWREKKLGTVHVWWREWRRGRITAYKAPNKRDQEVREKLGTRRQPETGKKTRLCRTTRRHRNTRRWREKLGTRRQPETGKIPEFDNLYFDMKGLVHVCH